MRTVREGNEMWRVLWDGGGSGVSGVTWVAVMHADFRFPAGGACLRRAELRALGAAPAARIYWSSSHSHCSLQPEQWGALSCFCSWLS